MSRRRHYGRKVCFILTRIPDLLVPDEGSVSDEMGKHDNLGLRQRGSQEWFRDLARYRDP
jgi:hypothetical protein